jgi:hypothetical protein
MIWIIQHRNIAQSSSSLNVRLQPLIITLLIVFRIMVTIMISGRLHTWNIVVLMLLMIYQKMTLCLNLKISLLIQISMKVEVFMMSVYGIKEQLTQLIIVCSLQLNISLIGWLHTSKMLNFSITTSEREEHTNWRHFSGTHNMPKMPLKTITLLIKELISSQSDPLMNILIRPFHGRRMSLVNNTTSLKSHLSLCQNHTQVQNIVPSHILTSLLFHQDMVIQLLESMN